MGFTTLERMKDALLTTTVSSLERIVLLDMATAVDDVAPVYSWGHDRLALALGKPPGTRAATRAVERVIGSLRARGLLVLTARPHRGRRAEYALALLDENAPRSERGAFGSRVTHDAHENAPRSEHECTPVSDGMDPGQTGVPLPISLPRTPPGKRTASGARRRPSKRQMIFVADLSRLLDVAVEPQTFAEAHEFIREHWGEVQRRAHNGEAFGCSIAVLSPEARRYAREHALLLDEGPSP